MGELDEARRARRDPARALRAVGRDEAEIERYDDRRHRHPRHARGRAWPTTGAAARPTARSSTTDWNFFVGTPAEIAEGLQPILALGFRHVLVDMPAPYDIETIGRIGELIELLERVTASSRSVVALAGGVGGAKLADGLAAHLGDRLSVVVNTGDDCERHGLLVMPDHDTVLYNLAGIEQVEWGWGIEGDTHATMAQLGAYGEEDWFSLGDRDLALHIARTARLRAGGRLTEVCLGLQRSLGSRRGSCRWPTSRCGPRSAPTTAGSSSRSTSSTAARRPTCTRSGSRGVEAPRPRPRSRRRSPRPTRS